MNWTRGKSLVLSLIGIGVFAAALLILNVGIWWIARWFFMTYHGKPWQHAALTLVSVYLCSVPGWLTLSSLWKLLMNLRRCSVFTEKNVRLLRRVSWR